MKLIVLTGILAVGLALNYGAGFYLSDPEVQRESPPVASDEELSRAFTEIGNGMKNHQYYIDNPDAQTFATGDTNWNIYWVDNYKLFQELIERAYGKRD